jgi:predicted aspartyl protease
MTLSKDYLGAVSCRPDHVDGPHELLLAVPCFIGESLQKTMALLDTGAEWCVLPPLVASALGVDATEGDPMVLHSRFGAAQGGLIRFPVYFHAILGSDLRVEATWFVSPDWHGPTVLGWRGCLERMRFALDPAEEQFYFAKLYRHYGNPCG